MLFKLVAVCALQRESWVCNGVERVTVSSESGAAKTGRVVFILTLMLDASGMLLWHLLVSLLGFFCGSCPRQH